MAIAYKKLYYSTDTLVSRFKPSFSNYFDVYINATYDGINTDDNNLINFLAYEAVLPGTSFETAQVFGDRQGITEQYPTKRVYPPVDVSFYIDHNYEILRFFESWLGKIAPNLGTDGSTDSYMRFNYPKSYETTVIITKFEKNFRDPNQKLDTKDGVYKPPSNYCTYTLKNAYPTNLISVPVSYEGANILRTTVTFNYDVYAFEKSNGQEINPPPGGGGGNVQGPGGDSQPQSPGAANQVRPNSLLTQEEYNAARAQGFAQGFGGAANVPTNFKNPKSQELLDQYNQTQNK